MVLVASCMNLPFLPHPLWNFWILSLLLLLFPLLSLLLLLFTILVHCCCFSYFVFSMWRLLHCLLNFCLTEFICMNLSNTVLQVLFPLVLGSLMTRVVGWIFFLIIFVEVFGIVKLHKLGNVSTLLLWLGFVSYENQSTLFDICFILDSVYLNYYYLILLIMKSENQSVTKVLV